MCVCVWLQQLMAFLSQTRPACEMRSDNRRRIWMCAVKSLLSGFSWMSVRASSSPGLYPGNWFIQRGEGIKHIQVEVSQSAVLQILPAEWKHSEVSGSTSLNARRASALTAAFSERRGSAAENTTNFLLFFLCLNKAFRRSSHQLIILFG